MTPHDFINLIGPSASASMAMTNVPASFVIAEAALESGWGSSQLCTEAKNLFGVKADTSWRGPTLVMNTRECLADRKTWVMVPAAWRKYDTWDRCMADHAQFFLSNHRYASAFQTVGGEAFAKAVAKAGYATDPTYADKLIAIMRVYNLFQWDVLPPATLGAALGEEV